MEADRIANTETPDTGGLPTAEETLFKVLLESIAMPMVLDMLEETEE
jgi:hypothetical protein